jgi:hypothetical protein
MEELPVVEFAIHFSDMRKAAKRLSVNRGEFEQTDFADLLVSSFAATFRSVGTEIEVPVNGRHPGAVRFPLRLFPKVLEVAETYNKPEIKLCFEQGKMRVEKFSWSYPDITLGTLPDLTIDLPPDAGALETLALASFLSPEQIADQGLRDRVETAQKKFSLAISAAAETLEEFGINKNQVRELVESSIRQRGETLRKAMGRESDALTASVHANTTS